MSSSYIEASLEIINELKAKGFTSVELVPHDQSNMQAAIELIPGKRLDFELNLILLDSPEIYHYIDKQSQLVKYIINKDHLTGTNPE